MKQKKRTSPRAWGLSAGLAVLAMSASVQADDTKEARVLYQKGNASFSSGDDVLAREYYRQSLELNEAFDTICNYGRSESRSKIFDGAYRKLSLCVYLYPKDKELSVARGKFVKLREEVRLQLDVDEADAIDKEMKAEFERRERVEEILVAPGSGLEDEEALESPWRVPVSASVAGLGVVGLGVGVGFFVHAGAKEREAEGLVSGIADDGGHCVEGEGVHEDCGELSDARKASDDFQNIAVAGLVAGGVLLAGGVLTYFLWPKGSAKDVSVAEPLISFDRENSQWQFGLQGSF